MSAPNTVYATIDCPLHGGRTAIEARASFGYRWQLEYEVGNTVQWWACEAESARPPEGDLDAPGTAKCPVCRAEFPVLIRIRNDVVLAVEVDRSRHGLDLSFE